MGPRDIADVSDTEGYINLGSVLLAPIDGIEVQVQADEATGAIAAVTVTRGGAALSVMAFAAPKSGGLWEQVRAELSEQVAQAGSSIDASEGAYGPQLVTQVPTQAPDGTSVMQDARFLGFDGPRWFCRCVLFGDAVHSDVLDDVVNGIVVNRGSEPMALGAPLPMRLPGNEATNAPAANRRDLNPFKRGPEITEVR